LLALADEVEPHDAAKAASLRRVASERVEQLVILERVSIRRRFDPAAPFAFGLFVLPAAVALVLRVDEVGVVDLADHSRLGRLDGDHHRGWLEPVLEGA
jgi:hypothetical protein